MSFFYEWSDIIIINDVLYARVNAILKRIGIKQIKWRVMSLIIFKISFLGIHMNNDNPLNTWAWFSSTQDRFTALVSQSASYNITSVDE